MNNPILYQGLGGLMIVFFLVMIYFFTRTWRWFHIVCVVFVFGASIFLLRNTAAVYRTLDTWRSDLAKTQPQIERLTEENDALRYGKADDSTQSVESLRLLRAKLRRTTLDLGRVWRHCTPSPPQADGSITINTVPVQPPAMAVDPAAAPADGSVPAPAAPPPNLIQDQTVLYAFVEQVAPPETGVPEGQKVPFYYLGDFVTVATTNNTVTVKPLTPPGPADRGMMASPNVTWALYETMPVDAHEYFTDTPDQRPNWNEPASTTPIFGAVSPETKKAIETMFQWPRFSPQFFANPAEMQSALALLQKSVAGYLIDGSSVTNKDEFKPDEIWTKVRFLKEKQEVVDSGAKVSPFSPGVTDDFFDQGMAEVAILQLGQEVSFKPDDVAVFPQDHAKDLIDAGICKFEEYVYVRPLNDYGFLFHNFDERFDRLADDQEQINRDLAELQVSQTSIQTQLVTANDEQAKLQQDLDKTREEATQIAAYQQALEQRWQEVRTRMSELYNSNLELEEKLERASQRRQELNPAPAADAVAGT